MDQMIRYSMMYNILSLGFGILAWIFGGSAALRGKFGGFSFASLSLCGISLTLQFYEIKQRVDFEDLSAIYDTIDALTFVATTLLVVTLVLNGIALLRERKMTLRKTP